MSKEEEKQKEARAKYDMMRVMRENSTTVSQEDFNRIFKEHQDFLKAGGGGGKWQTVSVGEGQIGLVMGIYLGSKPETGQQLNMSQKNLSGLNFKKADFSYANFVGAMGRDQVFDGSNLEGAIATDADFSGSSFKNVNLEKADFSRSILKNCDFTGANLAGTDFENADLEGAKGI